MKRLDNLSNKHHTVPRRFDIFLVLSIFLDVPKSITLRFASLFEESNNKFSGLRSL